MCGPAELMLAVSVASAVQTNKLEQQKARMEIEMNERAAKSYDTAYHQDMAAIHAQRYDIVSEKARKKFQQKVETLGKKAKGLNLNLGNPTHVLRDVATQDMFEFLDIRSAARKELRSIYRKEDEIYGTYTKQYGNLKYVTKPGNQGMWTQIGMSAAMYGTGQMGDKGAWMPSDPLPSNAGTQSGKAMYG